MSTGPRWRDAVVPFVLTVLAAIEMLTLDVDNAWAGIALVAGSCGLLVLRATWPWPIATAAGVLCALLPYLGEGLDDPATPILVLGLANWTLGRRLDNARGFASVALIELVIVSDFSYGNRGFDLSDVVFVTVMLLPPYFAGVGARTLVARNLRLAEQAAELLRLQETVRKEAAAAERGRIARELHDVIAHSVSAMVVQAAAASSLIDGDPERARQAVDDVGSTGRQALAETGRLLHLLRDDADELGLAPDCGLDRLGELVEDLRRRGLAVDLEVDGPLDGLPVGVDLSAYRICQEALTNALKHSQDNHVDLRVRRTGGRLQIRAANVAGPRGPSSGLGLLGMAERVSVFGGTLAHGFDEHGQFVLTAELPVGDT